MLIPYELYFKAKRLVEFKPYFDYVSFIFIDELKDGNSLPLGIIDFNKDKYING
jgi:hypothetical protein